MHLHSASNICGAGLSFIGPTYESHYEMSLNWERTINSLNLLNVTNVMEL